LSAIAGLWRWDGRCDLDSDVERMLRPLAIYGPDHGAHRTVGPVALGRRLKRFTPEDRYDRQLPEGGGRLLAADLRLDNRDELVRDLGLDPAWARTASDAAIAFEAIARWSEDALPRLHGPFALAWWDESDGKLRLARSLISTRPIHFHRADAFFAFASLPKGLHALPDVPYAADLDQFAARAALATAARPATFFVGIERLLGGRLLTVTQGGLREAVFWRPPRRTLRLPRAADYEEALREGLDRAVARTLRGVEGDVACELSGGLDSTSVTASAAMIQAGRGRGVVAYTHAPPLGFDGPMAPDRFPDESGHAAAVAALYPNIEHVIRRDPRRGLLDGWDSYIQLFDKPARGPANAAWGFDILDAVKARGLPVLLSGGLGNATISWEGRGVFSELIRAGRWVDWWRTANACIAHGGGSWRHVFKHTFEPELPLWLLRLIPRANAHEFAAAGRQSAAPEGEALRYQAIREEHLLKGRDSFERRVEWLLRIDLGSEVKGVLGGWGIDARDPTADLGLIELCLSIPEAQYFRGGVGRALVRDAMAPRLPPIVVNEQRAGLQSADLFERLAAARPQILAELDQLEAIPELARRANVAKLRVAVANLSEIGRWDRRDGVATSAVLLRTLYAARFYRRVMGVNTGTATTEWK
jgi:asparagine synthase (glutamine-hydrolysing)